MVLDCDLLIGRDTASARTVGPQALAGQLSDVGIDGGALGSLRALLFHMRSGNDEAYEVATARGWLPVAGLDLRDPLTAQREVERAATIGVRLLRLAPERQGVAPGSPRVRLLVAAATRAGMTLLVEGSLSTLAAGLLGLGARVVLLDLHFYDLGEFVLLAREEPGLHTSTRLLGAPGAWRTVLDELGPDRLLLGTRAGWFAPEAVLGKLRAAGLDERSRALVTGGNLLRLSRSDHDH